MNGAAIGVFDSGLGGLTTVRQPCYELGRTAGELLLTQIQGGPRGRAVYLPHTLIERDSTARCAVGS